jgi:ribonuclease HI
VDPTTSEAAAIKWALTLAKEECFSNIIVENDSLCCIDAINGSNLNAPWEISAICFDISNLALDFVSSIFSWVKREANALAHELAKFAVSASSPFCCNALSLPPSVMEAWQRDMLSFS